MTRLTKEILKEIRDGIMGALKNLESEQSVKFSMGNISFSETSATFQLSVSLVDKSGEVRTKEREDFLKYASTYGLEASDLGKLFMSRHGVCKIIGLLIRRPKYPIIAQNPEGQRICFTSEYVSAAISKYKEGKV